MATKLDITREEIEAILTNPQQIITLYWTNQISRYWQE